MAQNTSVLVDYEATSEEDNFSDFESRGGLDSPLPASSLRMPRWSSNTSLSSDCATSNSEQSDSVQLNESAQVPDGPSPEMLEVNSSTEEEGEGGTTQLSTCRQEEDDVQSPTDTADSSDSENSGSQDEGPAEYNGRSPRSPVLVDSSSEEEKPPTKSPRLQISSRGARGRGAYALKFHQLTPEMRALLARSRAFFTKPHSLQRPGGPVTISTYSKAEERILCKFFLRYVSLHTC